MSEAICLGIDLGTTNSCIACYFKGDAPRNPLIIDNEDSSFTTPSVVSFEENQILIGKQALLKRSENPENTLYCVKRLIGRKFNDPALLKDKKNFTYMIKKNDDNIPMLYVNNGRYKDRYLKPEQVSGMVLGYLKKCADNKCYKSTKKVVITVPANFNDYQRRATMDAAKIADLDPVCVISEPTAACIAHAYNTGFKTSPSHVLVYDFGGGTLDVSLVLIAGGEITVKATAGNSHCGGEDIDQKIYQMCHQKLKEKFGIDLDEIIQEDTGKDHKYLKAQLISLCEEAKRNLSTMKETEIILPEVRNDEPFIMGLKRADIDNIITEMQDDLIDPIKDVLSSAKMSPDQISSVILVGGSSRIPKVKDLIEDVMHHHSFSPQNPDEAIAFGASIYGAFKLGTKIKDFPVFTITDVTPLTIGFGLRNNLIQPAIPRNTPRPHSSSPKPFKPASPDITSVSLTVFEGESKFQSECYKVATFEIQIPKGAPRIFQRIDVTDSEITLYAIVSNTPPSKDGDPNEKKLIIKNDKPVNTPEQIAFMKNENIAMSQAKQEAVPETNYLVLATANCTLMRTAKMQMTKVKEVRNKIDAIVQKFKAELAHNFSDKKPMSQEEFMSTMNRFEDEIIEVLPEYKRPAKFKMG